MTRMAGIFCKVQKTPLRLPRLKAKARIQTLSLSLNEKLQHREKKEKKNTPPLSIFVPPSHITPSLSSSMARIHRQPAPQIETWLLIEYASSLVRVVSRPPLILLALWSERALFLVSVVVCVGDDAEAVFVRPPSSLDPAQLH